MTEYLTEQEQIQQIKTWVKIYGPVVLAGIIVALIITSSWQYWQRYRNKLLIHASNTYDEMVTHRAENDIEAANIQATKLLRNYKNTPYAQMASFMLARSAVLKKNYPEALEHLNWVIKHSSEPAMRQIARIRSARILIMQKKPSEALALLKKSDDKSFIGLVDEVRGDAYFSMQDHSSARQAYQLALAEIPNVEITRPILQMKYDNLAIGNNTKITT